jgi:hypothetical protein
MMIVLGSGWPGGAAFHQKLTFAAALLAIIAFVNMMAAGWARRGGPPSWLPSLHVAGALLLIGTVALAVLAFG